MYACIFNMGADAIQYPWCDAARKPSQPNGCFWNLATREPPTADPAVEWWRALFGEKSKWNHDCWPGLV